MKQKEKIAVTKIEIKIGGKTLSLTPEEMNELKDILNETFPYNTSGTTMCPMCLASTGGKAE